MFQNCYELTSLDVSGFNTANVTGMSYMFAKCRKLSSLDVSHFSTSKVENMEKNKCSPIARTFIISIVPPTGRREYYRINKHVHRTG